MSKPTPTTHTVNVNGKPFSFVEKVIGGNAKPELKGKPYLNLAAADWPTLTSFVAAVGQQALTAAAVKSVNSIVADGTLDAFVKQGDKYVLDPAAAAKGILDAIADSIRTGADEIKEKLAVLRGQQEELMKEVFTLTGKGQPIPSATVNRGLSLMAEVGQLESKLAKNKRTPKPAAAPATPAAAPAK